MNSMIFLTAFPLCLGMACAYYVGWYHGYQHRKNGEGAKRFFRLSRKSGRKTLTR